VLAAFVVASLSLAGVNANAGSFASGNGDHNRRPPGIDRGVSYDALYLPPHYPSDLIRGELETLRAHGVSSVYATASEADLADRRKLDAVLQHGHSLGLRVYLDPYIGGTFSGDEGDSALAYLAEHPEDATWSRFGERIDVPSIRSSAYRATLKRSLSALLEMPFDGVLLDEPTFPYPQRLAEGDYVPYDRASQAAFERRFGHAMPATETPEVEVFRQAVMRSFLEDLLDHAKEVRPDLLTILVVLPDRFEGIDRLGTGDWASLSRIHSLDVFQTDPYWFGDLGWGWFLANLDKLDREVTRLGLERGIWTNAYNLTTEYSQISRTMTTARDRKIEYLAIWITPVLPNADSTATWKEIEASYAVPFGALDGVVRTGGSRARVKGWTIDPETVKPTPIRITVDGRPVATPVADRRRTDILSLYPAFGRSHGFDATITIPPGDHEACVFAVNRGAGSVDPLLGCAAVLGR
jgi:hypothetical protein